MKSFSQAAASKPQVTPKKETAASIASSTTKPTQSPAPTKPCKILETFDKLTYPPELPRPTSISSKRIFPLLFLKAFAVFNLKPTECPGMEFWADEIAAAEKEKSGAAMHQAGTPGSARGGRGGAKKPSGRVRAPEYAVNDDGWNTVVSVKKPQQQQLQQQQQQQEADENLDVEDLENEVAAVRLVQEEVVLPPKPVNPFSLLSGDDDNEDDDDEDD